MRNQEAAEDHASEKHRDDRQNYYAVVSWRTKSPHGSIYYLPRPVPEADLAIMRHLDRLHLEFPFAGSRMLRGLLVAEGCKIGRRHVKTLMQRMGIEALYRRPRTTKPEPGHKIYPYLLRGLAITRPNQVWAMDITYIAMARGFVYLAVALDWFSRRVLAWRLSITMEAAFCIETLEDALARYGKPEIFNTDQGSQFTVDRVPVRRIFGQIAKHRTARFDRLADTGGLVRRKIVDHDDILALEGRGETPLDIGQEFLSSH